MDSWDCLSCGAHAQTKPFCEACGAAKPVDVADNALSLMLGLVCESCDAYNDPGVAVCTSCGEPLAPVDDAGVPAAAAAAPAVDDEAAGIDIAAILPPPEASPVLPPSWMTPPTGSPLATRFAMKKVDIGVAVKSEAGAAGLAAPIPTPTPSVTPVGAPGRTSTTPANTTVPPARPPQPAPSMPMPMPMPMPTPTTAAKPCAKCGTELAPDDRFCRNCGTRVGDIPAPAPAPMPMPMNTGQIAVAKLPAPNIPSTPSYPSANLPSPILPQGATMVMPAMQAAQLGPPAGSSNSGAGAGHGQPSTTLFFGAVQAERSAKLVLVRGQSAYGSQWRLQAVETVIGKSDGMVLFPDDDALAARHCRLVFKSGDLWLEPENTTNGVFVRLRDPVSLAPGDEVVVGAQRLRVLGDDDRPIHVRQTGDTRILGSLVKPAPPISLLRIAPEPAQNEVYHRHQRLLTMGRNNCDVNFPRDSFVSERHAQVTHDGNGLVLEDLRSRNGTYVRARGPTRLYHGDLVLLGDKVLRVELPR